MKELIKDSEHLDYLGQIEIGAPPEMLGLAKIAYLTYPNNESAQTALFDELENAVVAGELKPHHSLYNALGRERDKNFKPKAPWKGDFFYVTRENYVLFLKAKCQWPFSKKQHPLLRKWLSDFIEEDEAKIKQPTSFPKVIKKYYEAYKLKHKDNRPAAIDLINAMASDGVATDIRTSDEVSGTFVWYPQKGGSGERSFKRVENIISDISTGKI